MRVAVLSFTILLMSSIGFAFDLPNSKQKAELKSYMQSIFQSITVVLPMHLSQKKFYDPAQHKLIVDHLGNISKQAQSVFKVLRQSDEEHRILSQSLAEYARSAYRSFEVGAVDQAYYFTEELLETCLSCHTSRQSAQDSGFTTFAGNVDFDTLSPFAKAKFLSISRQFDKALVEYERILVKQPPTLAEILHFDPFLQYLTIGIRVRGENQRILNVLKKLVKMKDYAASVKTDMSFWIQSLESLQLKKFKQGTALAQAKLLLKAGRNLMEYPRDQAGAIYFLEASKRLKKFIQSKSIKSTERAEAYLLTGKSEMVLGRPFLGPEAKHYFEIAIMSAPKSETAKEAFSLYQENLIFGYTGSSGIHLPKDEKEKLEYLRKKALHN